MEHHFYDERRVKKQPIRNMRTGCKKALYSVFVVENAAPVATHLFGTIGAAFCRVRNPIGNYVPAGQYYLDRSEPRTRWDRSDNLPPPENNFDFRAGGGEVSGEHRPLWGRSENDSPVGNIFSEQCTTWQNKLLQRKIVSSGDE